MPVVAKLIGIKRLRQAAANVISQRHGTQECRTTSSVTLGHCQRRWHDATSRMRERRRMRVIGLVGVSEHAVRQSGIDGGGEDLAANPRSFSGASKCLHVGDRL